jgi:dihydrofolate synthase/folylpolyglutamate synthase
MEYHSALRYLYGLVDYEKQRIERYSPEEFRLDRVAEFLAQLGTPTSSLSQDPCCRDQGERIDRSHACQRCSRSQPQGRVYTSPHLHTYRERMRINGEPISRSEMAALVEEIQPVVETIPGLPCSR